MRAEFVILGVVVLLVAVVAAQKKKSDEAAELPPPPPGDDSERPSLPPLIMDGKIPYTGDRGTPPHHRRPGFQLPAGDGFGQGKGHKKNPHHGKKHPGKAFQDTSAIKEEIMRIKNADIPEEEKAARLKAFREHVRAGAMMENMPEEARERQQQLRSTIQDIMTNEELTQDEKRAQVAVAKKGFKQDMEAIRTSISPEEMTKMREERKKTIEGHTAAAMAARRAGHTEMARKYSRKAREAAEGAAGRPMRGNMGKKPSLSEPDFF